MTYNCENASLELESTVLAAFVAPPMVGLRQTSNPDLWPSIELTDIGLDSSGEPAPDEFEHAFIPDLRPMEHHNALTHIFRKADFEDYVAAYELKPRSGVIEPHDKDDYQMLRRGPLVHGRPRDVYAVIDSSGCNPFYINLASFHRSSIRPSKRKLFSATKETARAIHGVAVDLDVGRDENDPKAHVPGALLSQAELLWKFNALVFLGKIPPPHVWVNGTRGCYAIWLFDEPITDIDEAFRKWKTLRTCYLIPRLRNLAVDERFRSIIQLLKGPGACGKVKYFEVVDATSGDEYPLTSLDEMLSFFRTNPESCDIPEPQPRKRREQVADVGNLAVARTVKPTWARKSVNVEWCRQRADEMKKVTRHFGGEPHYPRREYMRDLASAIKTYHYRHSAYVHWYSAACTEIERHNLELARPLPPAKLKEIIHQANHGVWFNGEAPDGRHTPHRSTEDIVVDMVITKDLCQQLGLVHLRKPFDREDRARAVRDRKLKREEEKLLRTAEKAQQTAAKEEVKRRARREHDEAVRDAEAAQSARVARTADLRGLIRSGTPTSLIENQLGVHRETVRRERKRMQEEGEIVPEPKRMKVGRRAKA